VHAILRSRVLPAPGVVPPLFEPDEPPLPGGLEPTTVVPVLNMNKLFCWIYKQRLDHLENNDW
jgi:hypothetical protein